MKMINLIMGASAVVTCARMLVLSLPIAFAGCLSLGPYENVGEFKASGRKEHVGDVIYGFASSDDSCCIIQYRLTDDKVFKGIDFHSEFFATNFTCDCRLLRLLETNIVLFAKKEKSIVVVKGAFFNPATRIERDSSGRRVPEFYFAAIYDETPPEKAIGFLLPAEQDHYFPLPKYAYPLIEIERFGGIEVFGEIRDRERIRTSFSEEQWWWRGKRRRKANGHKTFHSSSASVGCGQPKKIGASSARVAEVRDPVAGMPVLSISGMDNKVLTEAEAKSIDTNRYAILEVKINEKTPEYSKDGKVKYSLGRGFYEQTYYEAAPDEGPYWMCLDEEYIRIHKPGCRKFERGRGRHCKLTEKSGQFGQCCGGRGCIVELWELQEKGRKKKASARGTIGTP